MLMKGLRTALVGIGFAISIAACDGGHSTNGKATGAHVLRNGLSAADPGVPVPGELAGEFDDCLSACRAAADACEKTCCQEVTGSGECFVE